uniref:Dynein heavy chain 8, axonemal-like n=1 Tax=Diabrotica virgifera virgifera TaxID=50390 RepID=A0A6P7GBN3_DIAVI
VLEDVMEASEVANKIKEEALVVKDRAENLVGLISVDQKEAESKLMAAKPALDAAEAALLTIKAADIATVRKLGKPPYLILLIMDAVLIYFKRKLEPVKPDPERNFLVPSWSESLKVMAEANFLKRLQDYPKDTINAEIVDLLTPYFSYPIYTFEAAKTACGNVAGLISWTLAMASFFDVNREVLPLKANLAIQQAKLSRAEEELGAAMELLRTKEEEVRGCQEQYEEAMTFKQHRIKIKGREYDDITDEKPTPNEENVDEDHDGLEDLEETAESVSITECDEEMPSKKRIVNIIDYLTYEIFKYKSRGLYEEHKYMFVLLMCLRIDLERETITHEEFQNFIKGGAALDLNACPAKPAKWITDSTWLNLVALSKLRHFQYIVQQVTGNDRQWKIWFDKDAPEESVIPDGYNSLDTFRKLLMIRAWCPDRTVTQSRKYISNSLGQKFAEPVILNMETLFYESRPLTPIICFLSIGSDPTPYIEQLARRLELKVRSISMGQGQEVHARKLMTLAMSEGFWALLQNCHLSLDYMNEVLVQFLELEKGIGSTHPDFRLWITTEVHESFPISLLQICIKFTNEPPSGIRAGLMRTYTSMNQDLLDYSDAWQYIPLVYAISFLHTVVQERRKFGPLGWNIPYEFNSADWLSSVLFVQNHLDDLDPKRGINWQTLRYMLGEVHYGGRVTDDFDKRLLNTFCKVWFSELIFVEDFMFYKGYKIVKYKSVTDYIAHIDGFAPTDPPQAYGLHSNADITYQTNTTIAMFDYMLAIQPKESGGTGGESRESVVQRLAKEMLTKLPNNYDPFEVKDRLKIMGQLNPLNIFLRQEIDRMQKVITIVRSTLRDLLLAIEGTIIMSEALGDALDMIYDAKVPSIWLRPSWVASTLGFWFTELIERDNQFRTWCFTGRPACFWMAGFFNPQGFLTAMKQEVARAHKGWALDNVKLFNEVTKLNREEILQGPVEGVFVYGLFLDGAGWDKKHSRLAESINKVLYTLVPVVHIYALYNVEIKTTTLYVVSPKQH